MTAEVHLTAYKSIQENLIDGHNVYSLVTLLVNNEINISILLANRKIK